MHSNLLPDDLACAAAAGQWMARAEGFLRAYQGNLLSITNDNGKVFAENERFTSARQPTGHDSLCCHAQLLAPDVVSAFIGRVQGSINVCSLIYVRDPTMKPAFNGVCAVAQGSAEFQNKPTEDWMCIAHNLALICVATSNTSFLHQAFFYSLLGAPSQEGVLDPVGIHRVLDHGVSSIALNTPHVGSTLTMPRLPEGTTRTALMDDLVAMADAVIDASSKAYTEAQKDKVVFAAV